MTHHDPRIQPTPCKHCTGVPNTPRSNPETFRTMPLHDRVLMQEHQRHADRLAEIRAVAAKLPALDDVVSELAGSGVFIDLASVREGWLTRIRASDEASPRRITPVNLRAPAPVLNHDRRPAHENAVANALLLRGWRVVNVCVMTSEISLDIVVLQRGHRAVQTTCMRQWVIEAVMNGYITKQTPGWSPELGEPTAPLATPDEH